MADGRVSYTQSNPLFDMSLSGTNIHSFQPEDLKPARPRRRWCFHVTVVYLVLQTVLNAFLLYKVFTLQSSLSGPKSQSMSPDHSPLEGEPGDEIIQTLVRNNSQETRTLRGHLWALQNQVQTLCGEEGQLHRLRSDLNLLNTSTNNMEDKLTKISLKPGLPGPPGKAGLPGSPGAPGLKGDSGAAGTPGSKGDMGPKGERGGAGATGLPGPPGKGGLLGSPGAPGLKGDSGAAGTPGSKGDMGPKGERGGAGATGPVGPPGRPGPPGASGKQGLGVKGEKGDPGVQGPSGGKGDKGDTGNTGPHGPPGAAGVPGQKGATGVSGQRGPPGPPGPPGPSGAVVRLMPGPSRGRVEVNYQGVWGTVCDDKFDAMDGKVICRMLGYRTATDVFTASAGSGKIWLDDLGCSGSESSIFSCPHAGMGVNNCGHNEDAGVQCA